MGAKRLPMRKLREILRLKYERRMSHRAIARACVVGVGTVSEYVRRAKRAGLSWPLPADLDDGSLEARLFLAPAPQREEVAEGPESVKDDESRNERGRGDRHRRAREDDEAKPEREVFTDPDLGHHIDITG